MTDKQYLLELYEVYWSALVSNPSLAWKVLDEIRMREKQEEDKKPT